MIKVNKDLEDVPASLDNMTTQARRNELIKAGRYIDKNKYHNRYKQSDVKRSLKTLYRGKCAFCEQCIEQFHVEHFRPKSIYYWLAYSWDNLLAACATCNQHKDNKFEILRTVAVPPDNLDQIHQLSEVYNEQEGNRLVCPEQEDTESLLVFGKDGSVHSEDERVSYTIDTCKLDRTNLRDRRKKLWDDLEVKLINRLFEHQLGDPEALSKIEGLMEDFAEDADDLDQEFVAFRRYAVKHFLPTNTSG